MERQASAQSKHGVRIHEVPGGKQLLIKQTVLKRGRYVLDALPSGLQREAFVDAADDAAIAKAVRLAIAGKLGRSLKGVP